MNVTITYSNPKHNGILSVPINEAEHMNIATGRHSFPKDKWDKVKNNYYVKELMTAGYLDVVDNSSDGDAVVDGVGNSANGENSLRGGLLDVNDRAAIVINNIENTSDPELLRKFRDKEMKGEGRKTVLKAVEKQLQLLDESSQDPESEKVET